METAIQFDGEAREKFGKGQARALRKEGKVPAILYGPKNEPVHFTLEEKELKREYHKGGFFGKVATIKIDGKECYGVPKDLQLHPVNDRVIHADFYQIEKGQEIKIVVPVRFINYDRCIGIKRGGALNVVRYDLELTCQPNALPESIEVDLQELNIGDSVHISHITLPEGVRSSIDRDFTIAAVAGRVSKEARETEGEEGEEVAETEGGEE